MTASWTAPPAAPRLSRGSLQAALPASGTDGATGSDGSGAAREEVIQTVLTDAFGDFKFDGLQGDSGEYVVEVASNGHGPARLTVTLGQSVNLGTIMVGGER